MEATFGQAFQSLKFFNDQELSQEQWQELFNSGLLADIFEAVKLCKPIDRKDVRKALGLDPLYSVYKVVVGYGLSLAEMIKDGKYSWVNDDITQEHFPVKGTGNVELGITLLHFNRYLGSDEAIKEMDKMGYRPATLPELLALGASQPELQRYFPIVGLGSVWQRRNGYRCVPCLWIDGSKRLLDLDWLGGGWLSRCRFAVARK